MKIAFVGPYPSPGETPGSGSRLVIDSLLREMGKCVELSLIVPGSELDHVETIDDIKIYYLRRNKMPGFLRYWRGDAQSVARTVEHIDPDIVHFHCGSGAARFTVRPRIVTVHGILERDIIVRERSSVLRGLASGLVARLVAYVEKKQRAKVGNIIAISPFMRDALPDLNHLRTFDIPNPVAPWFLDGAPVNSNKRERLLVIVQKIGPLKNTLELLQVVARALKQDKEARLVLCGTAPNKNYYNLCRKIVRDSELDDRVTFTGYKTQNEIIALLDRACCYITMTLQETASLAAAEAMCRGAAVIAPNNFGFSYSIEPGRNGFFWPTGGLDEKASLLLRSLDHEWDRPTIAAEARGAHDPKHVAERTLEVYHEILSLS